MRRPRLRHAGTKCGTRYKDFLRLAAGDKVKIYLIRHGISIANEQIRYAGTWDVPLSENGVRDVEMKRDAGLYPKKGVLAEGSDADIVIFDPEKKDVISADTHAYNTDNNPFEGFTLQGGVEHVFLRGNPAVRNGQLIKEKLGTFIKRGKNIL